ncbi:hypothetical protein CR51_41420 [Caballeronia megalochromosomata]|nr:hypothetical protein CR51_41420 [Caballeronia megalochromosomata]
MKYRCCHEQRRLKVSEDATLNGIDYLEVIDHDLAHGDPLRQRTLLVHCFKPLPAGSKALSAVNVSIEGGERIRGVKVQWAAAASPVPVQLVAPDPPDTAAAEAPTLALVQALADGACTLVVRTDVAGDFSAYTLCLVASSDSDAPPDGFDPCLRELTFAFKAQCASDFDCVPPRVCAPRTDEPPEIDYLAKDYPGFRRLILDRLSQLAPQWRQSSEADTGVAVAELLAYVCDHLSYQQDAVATEAYLNTARRRVSLRRHAVLVDYPMHDGCNARAWVQVRTSAESLSLSLAGLRFLTQCGGFDPEIAPGPKLEAAMLLGPLVFEAMLDPRMRNAAGEYRQSLHAAHNEMRFYTWDDESCCLAQGATRATLKGAFPALAQGDVLVLEERVGPLTGEPGDADPSHRHAVRLTEAHTDHDPLGGQAITQIAWAAEDALPFSLCVSGDNHGEMTYLDDIGVARGNIVLVDHGATLPEEVLGAVPRPSFFNVAACCADPCKPAPPDAIPPRYRPVLAKRPLTQAAGQLIDAAGGVKGTEPYPYDPFAPAAQVIDANMSDVVPQLDLRGVYKAEASPWSARRNLFGSSANDRDFVVEVDETGDAALRFGDNERGMRPDSTTAFSAWYRIGNGAAGNVGPESIAHVVGTTAAILGVRNPCAARGGVDPEDAASVRRHAPEAFRTQRRAVTLDDYASVAGYDARVQRAAASMRWTGSWYTVFLTVDPVAGADASAVKAALPGEVDPYRMAGVDLECNDPHYVPLQIGLHVCVMDDHFRSDIRRQLMLLFSNRALPDRKRALFHPDNYTFGQSVYLSQLYEAAHGVPGVAAVQVTKFQRQGTDDPAWLLRGEFPIGPFEIARMDNDPNYPEHGVLELDIHGGK